MGQKIVKVVPGPETGKLSITPNSIELFEGDWVQWEFSDLKEGEFGFIAFASPRLGPFYSLRSGGDDLFLGKGNQGAVGKFSYTALILRLDRCDAVASGTGTIDNQCDKKDTSPDVEVTYDGETKTFTVSPFKLRLNAGDTATWRFLNIPPDAFACFKFASVTDSQGNPVQGTDRASGPFLAFNACRVDASGVVEASGMGFTAAIPVEQRPVQFTYHLQLRDWNGNLIAGHDPIIDNLGPPVPTGGE